MSASRKWQVCTVCLVAAVIIYLYAGPITLLCVVRSNIRNDPKIEIVPTPLNVKDRTILMGRCSLTMDTNSNHLGPNS